MNAKTCKRMRRYIKSLGFHPDVETMYQRNGIETPVVLPYNIFGGPKPTLTVHLQTFRGQYRKLKRAVKQRALYTAMSNEAIHANV